MQACKARRSHKTIGVLSDAQNDRRRNQQPRRKMLRRSSQQHALHHRAADAIRRQNLQRHRRPHHSRAALPRQQHRVGRRLRRSATLCRTLATADMRLAARMLNPATHRHRSARTWQRHHQQKHQKRRDLVHHPHSLTISDGHKKARPRRQLEASAIRKLFTPSHRSPHPYSFGCSK
jgi:hypothetical protein